MESPVLKRGLLFIGMDFCRRRRPGLMACLPFNNVQSRLELRSCEHLFPVSFIYA